MAAGVTVRSPAFWSHAEVNQSAAIPAGCVPPITNPKNRPDGIAVSPGSTACGQQLDDRDRIGRAVGQLRAEGRDHLGDRGSRRYGAVGQGGQPRQGVLVSASEGRRGVGGGPLVTHLWFRVSVNPSLASTRREAVFQSQTVAHRRSYPDDLAQSSTANEASVAYPWFQTRRSSSNASSGSPSAARPLSISPQ